MSDDGEKDFYFFDGACVNTINEPYFKKETPIYKDFKVEVIDIQEERRKKVRAECFREKRRNLTSTGKEREREVKALLIEEHGKDYLL